MAKRRPKRKKARKNRNGKRPVKTRDKIVNALTDAEANLAEPFIRIIKDASWAQLKAGLMCSPEDRAWVDSLFRGLDDVTRRDIGKSTPEVMSAWAKEAIAERGIPFGDDEASELRAENCGAYLAASFGDDQARSTVLGLIAEAAEKAPETKPHLNKLADQVGTVTAVEEATALKDALGLEALQTLLANMERIATDIGLDDLTWIVDLAEKDIDTVECKRLIAERYPDKTKAKQVAHVLMLGGEFGAPETRFSTELNGRIDGKSAEDLYPLKGLFSKRQHEKLNDEMRIVGERIIAEFAKPGRKAGTDWTASPMGKRVTKIASDYLHSMSQNIQRRYPHLDRHQAQTVLDFSRVHLQEFVNEGTTHVRNIERLVECFQRDEIQLLFHTLFVSTEAGDPLALLTQWYVDEEPATKEAVVRAAMEMRAAVEDFGYEQVIAMIDDFTDHPSAKPGRAAVRHYLKAMGQAFDRANENDRDDTRPSRLIWAALRNARVFELSSDTFGAIVDEVHHYIQTKVMDFPEGKISWDELTDDEASAATDVAREAANRLPLFDDIMPFEHLFIGFDGDGINVPESVVRQKVTDPPKKVLQGRLLGYLIGPIFGSNVDVIEFMRVTGVGNEDYVVPCIERLGNISSFSDEEQVQRANWSPAWMHPDHMTPWVVNSILSFIHEHKTLVLEQHLPKKVKRSITRETKAIGYDMIPRPYYLVPLRNLTVKDAARRSVGFVGKRAPLSHRHDRRGHERVLVQRGALPLSDKKRKILEKAQGTPPVAYTVYTVDGLNAEHARLLMERNQPPKREGEWVAVKVRYIEQAIIGDESLPYVPGVRVSIDRRVQSRIRRRDDRPVTSRELEDRSA